MGRYRTERVGILLQEKIGGLILDGAIKDPRVDAFLSVTRVEVSRDLVWADVFVSGYKTEEALKKGVAGLNSAAGFIQSRIAGALRLRVTPRLRFYADFGPAGAFALNQKIDSLIKESAQTTPGSAD
ncbi:MAG: 30S ribosome-binding factor RbfA [Spirochaetaceae bacterium]|jgi:ribosome-binding factor A|nr:30S ribosome-binding factor RbfA [Spirochaetaceae bacterium]